MSAATIRERIGGSWEQRPDGFWRSLPAFLHGRRRAAGALRLSWHWDVSGTLLSVDALLAPGERPPTVVDLYPGADWAEREAREYYRVEFEGRAATPPLMLREGDAPGLLLRGGEVGR